MIWDSVDGNRGLKLMLKNVNWEQGFQRLWRLYACIFICGTILSKYLEYFSFHSIDSENWLTPLADLIGTWDPEFWLLLLQFQSFCQRLFSGS